jgi:transposase, IS30 family
VVDKKLRLGDWEADTVIGKGHQGVLVTLTERVSKLNLAVCVPSNEAERVTKASVRALQPFKKRFSSMRANNLLITAASEWF